MNCKGLILLPSSGIEWVKTYLPDQHPYNIKVVNKPLIQYYLDLLFHLGITEIRLLFENPDQSLRKQINTINPHLKISYGFLKKSDPLKTTLLKNRAFINNQPLLIYSGFGFLGYNLKIHYHLHKSFLLRRGDQSLYYLHNGILPEQLPHYSNHHLSLHPLDSIKSYFTLSMNILNRYNNRYLLPGYNNEKNIYIDQYVEVQKYATINPPVMVGHHVRINPFTTIGPGVIIGNNILIGSETEITRSIIYDASFIGDHLEINNKIIIGNRIIDPESEVQVTLDNSALLSTIDQLTASLTTAGNLGIASILMGYIFLGRQLLRKKRGKRELKTFFLNKERERIELELPLTFLERLLLQDKYPLLKQFFQKKIPLVGNRLCSIGSDEQDIMVHLYRYTPGVFGFSETLRSDQRERILAFERCAAANRSFLNDLKTVIKVVLNRGFGG